jgi:hypothetical protein
VVTPIIVRLCYPSVLLVLIAFLARFDPLVPAVSSQGAVPLAANIILLLSYPDFYEGRYAVVRGEVVQSGDRLMLKTGDGGRTLPLLLRDATPSGEVDVRGELWDVGKMKPDDPRASGYDLARIATPRGGEWPKPGELLVFAVRSVADAIRPVDPTVRSVVLEPGRYEGQVLTLRGQYGARNLSGELPRAPGVSRYDFVIRSGGAAIWVTGMRPRGKDFDFDLDSKLDTARWLEVVGTVKGGRGLQWLEAKAMRMVQPINAPEPGVDSAPPPPPPVPVPPPQVVFSVPTEGETDVPTTVVVRIQTSRDLDQASLRGHIRVGYLGQAAGTVVPPTEFEVTYDPGNRAIEVKFAKPLERFRTVRLELLEGIVASGDKQPLAAWALTFSLGG